MKTLNPYIIAGMMAFILAIGITARSQVTEQHLRFADSIENIVNLSLKQYVVKRDTGRTIIAGSKKQTAFYKKEFYSDPKNHTLCLVNYLRRTTDGMLINETYYYLRNKPISAYRLKQVKRKILPEEAYYFYKDKTYSHNDSTVLKTNNEIKKRAEAFLAEFKRLK